MNQQIVDQLAKDILSLTEKEEPSQQNIGIRGTELIQEFIQKPGVEDSLAKLDIRKKVRLWGSQGSGIQILLHGADTPKRGSPHDHGRSWALYFQVSGVTEMSTYHRISGVPGRPGRAVLEKTDCMVTKDQTSSKAVEEQTFSKVEQGMIFIAC